MPKCSLPAGHDGPHCWVNGCLVDPEDAGKCPKWFSAFHGSSLISPGLNEVPRPPEYDSIYGPGGLLAGVESKRRGAMRWIGNKYVSQEDSRIVAEIDGCEGDWLARAALGEVTIGRYADFVYAKRSVEEWWRQQAAPTILDLREVDDVDEIVTRVRLDEF